MESTHRAIVGDSRDMSEVGNGEVDLVVTSPPYPMIEMWDGTFAGSDPEIEDRLRRGEGRAAFDLMHGVLAETWAEVERVLAEGGIACINVGDATRSIDGSFRRYPNHARVTDWFTDNGFVALPDVLWRKPTNSAAKFMGSGMLPPNAYVTLEHEYVLIFRKGEPRSFPSGSERRYESAYLWEERNEWFSDVWEGVTGERQALGAREARERSGAFPFEIPYRLINMFSVYGDTVLDPFWGTGTTTLAAMVAGRDSIGYELEEAFATAFEERIEGIEATSREVIEGRLDRHEEFIAERRASGEEPEYTSANYGFPVVTSQEVDVRFYVVRGVERSGDVYRVTHLPYEEVGDRYGGEGG